MSEKLNLNNYKSVERVPGLPGVLEGIPKDGGTPARFKEELVLKTMDHTKKERQDYNKEFLSKDTWPEEKPPTSEAELKWNTFPKPKPAKWDSKHDGLAIKVNVLAESDPDKEGNVYCKIDHPVAADSPIPMGELNFIIEPEAPDEPAKTDPEKKDKNVEDLPAKERALHPETILKLKEQFEELKKNYLSPLESLKKSGRAAEAFEIMETTSTKLFQEMAIDNYLDGLPEQDREEVEPLRNDLLNKMNISEDALEIERKMMSGSSEASDPTEEVEKSTKFKEDQQVKVLRANGTMEDGWVVESDELQTIDGVKYITVMQKQEDGTLYKDVPEEDLEKWNSAGSTTTPEANTEDDSWIKVGDLAIYKNGDITERNWRIDDKRVITKEGKKYVVLRNSDLHTTAEVEYEKYKKWVEDERGPVPADAASTPPAEAPAPGESPPPTEVSETTPAKTEEEKGWLKKKWEKLKLWAGKPAEKFVTYVMIEGDPNSPENQKKKRRAKAGFWAGVILVPLGLLAAYKLGVSHSDIDGGSGGGGVLGPDSSGGGTEAAPKPEYGNSGGGNHHEVFNNENGNRTVESILPENLEQKRVNGGYEQIVDKHTGETVVEHATYAGNGRYSIDTIRDLKDDGYSVGTNTIELGDTTHKVSVVKKA